MNCEQVLELANLDAAITRNRGYYDSCYRHNAPQEALEVLDQRFIELLRQKSEILDQQPHFDYGPKSE